MFFILFFLLINGIEAAEFNCKELYKAGYPDFRFPSGMICQLSKKESVDGVSFESYHYTESFPQYPNDDKFDQLAFTVFNDVYTKLVEINPTLTKKLYFTGLTFILSNHIPEANEVAKVRIGHSQEGENCPIIVYAKALAKESSERQKQMLAHEVFHCIQDTIWREKKLGVENKVDSWWAEGSAVWFSNFIYPNFNQENDYNFDYKGEMALTNQETPYSTHSFFQSFSQSYLGFNGVIDFIESMPSSGGKAEQLAAVLAFPSLSMHFHNFATQLTSNKIQDFNASLMTTNLASDPIKVKIIEGENSLNWLMEPLQIQLREIELPSKSIITIENQTEADENAISFRQTPTGLWNYLYRGYPTTIDLSCKSHSKTVELLSSFASKSDDKKYSVNITSKKSECKCFEKEKFDPCLVGKYKIDPSSIEKMFSKIFKDNYTVESASGDYHLLVNSSKKFNFDFNLFTVSVVIHDETMGDMRAQVSLTGSTEASGKNIEKDALCFSDIGDDLKIHLRLETASGTMEAEQPYNQFDELSNGQLKYTCNKSELIFLRKLPSGESGETEIHPIRFIRD